MKQEKPPILLLIIFILIGAALTYFGAKGTYNTIIKTKDYASTEGTFIRSEIYSSDDDGTTYSLTYSYIVNGQQYTIKTDYGTQAIPKLGSIKTIKYNAYNPSQAIITGFNSDIFLLLGGVMFIGVPLVILLSDLRDRKKKYYKAFDIFLGLFIAFWGSAFYYIMCNGSDSLSIVNAFQSAGLWILIPILFVVVGLYLIIKTIFTKKKDTELEVEKQQELMEQQEKFVNIVSKAVPIMSKIVPIYQIFGCLVFVGVCTWIFIAAANTIARLFITPFLVCGIAILVMSIMGLIKAFTPNTETGEKMEQVLNKIQNISANIYNIAFYIYWFGFLIVADYIVIKDWNNNGLYSFCFLLIFWAVGIFMVYKRFKR